MSTKTVLMATKPAFIFTCSHCSCTILLKLHTLCKHKVMLIYILIDIQHLQNIIFSFEIGLIGESISSSDYHHSTRKSPPAKFPISPYLLTLLESPVWPCDKLKPSYLHYRVSTTTKLGKLMTILWASIQTVTRSLITRPCWITWQTKKLYLYYHNTFCPKTWQGRKTQWVSTNKVTWSLDPIVLWSGHVH